MQMKTMNFTFKLPFWHGSRGNLRAGVQEAIWTRVFSGKSESFNTFHSLADFSLRPSVIVQAQGRLDHPLRCPWPQDSGNRRRAHQSSQALSYFTPRNPARISFLRPIFAKQAASHRWWTFSITMSSIVDPKKYTNPSCCPPSTCAR